MDFATPQVHKSGNALHVTHGSDAGLYVEFFEEALPLGLESENAGHPVFRNVSMIRIMFPGDKTKTFAGEVTDEHKRRFAAQWDMYRRGDGNGLIGMPLKEWSPLTKADVAMWGGMGIYTVEQLSAINDSNLPMGGRVMRDKAQAWLKQAGDGAETLRLAKENQQQRDLIQKQADDIAELARRLEALEAKRGKAA